MSYSLKTVFGIPGSLCEKTSRLLSERSLAHPEPESISEDSEEGGSPESMGSDTETGPQESHRFRSVNRDDITLIEWRRLAGIE
jgi:hypothetical protein